MVVSSRTLLAMASPEAGLQAARDLLDILVLGTNGGRHCAGGVGGDKVEWRGW